jgi:ubiquinol-cytochrome c reductase cytochrome c subunit
MRLNLLLFFGILAAPLAWTGQLVVGYGIGDARCSWDAATAALFGAAAVIAVAGLAVAVRLERSAVRDERGRVGFLAGGGVLVSAVFVVLIVLGGIGALSVDGCRGALAATPPQRGQNLYGGYCIRCHGALGAGSARKGPPLRGVGAQAADFYLRTGYMPLRSGQPRRQRPRFGESDIDALVAYVASLGGGPRIPHPHPERGSLAEGLRLFTANCAGCHQVAAVGGIVTGGRVPTLARSTPVQVAEAVRIGPYLMPRFSERQLSDAQLDSIVRYVQWTRSPHDPGGWSIGHVGPVNEGLVAWLVAGSALLAVALAIGRKVKG